MARTTNAVRHVPPPLARAEQLRPLKLVPNAAGPANSEVELLEIAYGGGWDCFDSDDIDAMRESGSVWLPGATNADES